METAAPAVMPLGLSGASLRLFAAIALLATVLARGLMHALPGARAGITSYIWLAERTSTILSQAAAVGGALLTIRILLVLRRTERLGGAFWLLAIPCGMSVSLVLAAMQGTLVPPMTLGLGMLAGVIALGATPPALIRTPSRAAGLSLAAAGFAAVLYLTSRVIALDASERALRSLFDLARNIATCAVALDLVSWAIALLWWCTRRWSLAAAAVIVQVALAALVVSIAQRSSALDASLTEVLVGRTLSEFVRNPAPFVPLWSRQALEVLLLTTSVLLIVTARRSARLQVGLSLALLSRACADVPALALFLILAALLCALGAVESELDKPLLAGDNEPADLARAAGDAQ